MSKGTRFRFGGWNFKDSSPSFSIFSKSGKIFDVSDNHRPYRSFLALADFLVLGQYVSSKDLVRHFGEWAYDRDFISKKAFDELVK